MESPGKNVFELVREFTVGHNSDNGIGTPDNPQHATLKDLKFLTTVLNRELLELVGQPLDEQIDGGCDLMLYLLDFFVRMGWNVQPYIVGIAQANLRKKFPDGKYKHHESGKVIKPNNYKPFDLNDLLHKHLSEGSWED